MQPLCEAGFFLGEDLLCHSCPSGTFRSFPSRNTKCELCHTNCSTILTNGHVSESCSSTHDLFCVCETGMKIEPSGRWCVPDLGTTKTIHFSDNRNVDYWSTVIILISFVMVITTLLLIITSAILFCKPYKRYFNILEDHLIQPVQETASGFGTRLWSDKQPETVLLKLLENESSHDERFGISKYTVRERFDSFPYKLSDEQHLSINPCVKNNEMEDSSTLSDDDNEVQRLITSAELTKKTSENNICSNYLKSVASIMSVQTPCNDDTEVCELCDQIAQPNSDNYSHKVAHNFEEVQMHNCKDLINLDEETEVKSQEYLPSDKVVGANLVRVESWETFNYHLSNMSALSTTDMLTTAFDRNLDKNTGASIRDFNVLKHVSLDHLALGIEEIGSRSSLLNASSSVHSPGGFLQSDHYKLGYPEFQSTSTEDRHIVFRILQNMSWVQQYWVDTEGTCVAVENIDHTEARQQILDAIHEHGIENFSFNIVEPLRGHYSPCCNVTFVLHSNHALIRGQSTSDRLNAVRKSKIFSNGYRLWTNSHSATAVNSV